jgi:hypothetical protein
MRIISMVIWFSITGIVYSSNDKVRDPLWMFTDNDGRIYQYFSICDTSRKMNFNCKYSHLDQFVDTGNTYNKSKYICFNYQFSNKTFYIYDEFDTTLVRYKDCRPGFAGFKMEWDYGMIGYKIARYTYLIFAHQGANPEHKVTVRAWYNDGTCGSPSYNELIGTFYPSKEWKIDTIFIPEFIRFKNDNDRQQNYYYELVFIINNLDPSDTTAGAPGCLKLDDIRLSGYNPIDTSPQSQIVEVGKTVSFKVAITPFAKYTENVQIQWKKNGVVIPGATSTLFTIASVRPEDFGVYNVEVTVEYSGLTFTSLDALLTVKQLSSVIEKPKNEASTRSGTKINEADSKECGCGSGAGLALLPPLWFRIQRLRKRK